MTKRLELALVVALAVAGNTARLRFQPAKRVYSEVRDMALPVH